MADDFYGKDLAFKDDFQRSPTGDLDTITGLDNLKEAVVRMILTTPGSVIHRPGFGVGLKNYQNAINNLGTQQELSTKIKEQLERDPRIEKYLGIRVTSDDYRPGIINILIRYKPVGYGEQSVDIEEQI